MFPGYGDTDEMADEAEYLLAQMYDEALKRWVPSVRAAVLPTMADGTAFPVDPDAFTATTATAAWDELADAWVTPAMMVLWCYHHLLALDAIGPPALTADGGDNKRKPKKPRLTTRKELRELMDRVDKWEMPTAEDVAAGIPKGPRPINDVPSKEYPFGWPDQWRQRMNLATPPPLPDPVAEAFARAWRQDPGLIRDVTLKVWKMPWSHRQMMDYLGATKSIRGSVPGQIRDLVLGEISAGRRTAIPRDAVEYWLKLYSKPAQVMYAPTADDVPSVPITQASGIVNHALVTAMKYSPDPLDKIWIAHMDNRTRPAHYVADGQRVAMDANFTVGGHEMAYPGDPAAPPGLAINCRCRVGVVKVGDELPSDTHRNPEQLREIASRSATGQIRAREDPAGIGYRMTADMADTSHLTSALYASASEEQENPMNGDTKVVDGETYLTFTDALFAVTGVPTDDRRMLAKNMELKMRDFPLPLMWQEATGDGHRGSVGIGVIESMTYKDGELRGSGYILNNDSAAKALDLIAHGVANPSIDMADATGVLAYEDGTEVTEDNFDESKPMFETYTRGTITAATIVSIPAFGQTRLSLNSEREARMTGLEDAIVAAGRYEPPVYDPAMFADADPNLLHTHRLKIDPDTGHVYGFIARWTDQHRSVGLGNIRPPRSETGYEHFHTSPGVRLTDGRTLPVGRLTVGIGHAPTRGVSAAAAQAHYDNVDACWAIGRVSEHRLGLYFSGVVAPWASPEKVQMGLASPVSGDWRPIGPNRNLELVAVLSVNTPGFLCKVETDAAGDPLAMVASMDYAVDGDSSTVGLTLDAIKAALAEVLDSRIQFAAKDQWKLGTAPDCPDKRPFAVISTETGKTESCHATDREARRHISALRDGTMKPATTVKASLDDLSDRARALLGEPPKERELTPTERMAALLSAKGGQ